MKPYIKGSDVKQVIVPITGKILDVKYDADASSFSYLVEFINSDDSVGQRWFNHDDVEAA